MPTTRSRGVRVAINFHLNYGICIAVPRACYAVCNSCNMGMRALQLPDIYAQQPEGICTRSMKSPSDLSIYYT